jgi:hypothetical protein
MNTNIPNTGGTWPQDLAQIIRIYIHICMYIYISCHIVFINSVFINILPNIVDNIMAIIITLIELFTVGYECF